MKCKKCNEEITGNGRYCGCTIYRGEEVTEVVMIDG